MAQELTSRPVEQSRESQIGPYMSSNWVYEKETLQNWRINDSLFSEFYQNS